MFYRPAPWSPAYAKYYYGVTVLPALTIWVAAAMYLAYARTPAAWVVFGTFGVLASAGTTLWASAARRAPGMTPFALSSQWLTADAIVTRMEEVPELRSLTRETWQALSDASFVNDHNLLFNDIVASARALIETAESRPDAVAAAKRTKELLDGVRTEAEERFSS